MGRKGDALRAAKKQAARYSIGGKIVTNAELLQRDQAVIAAYRKDLEARMDQTASQYVRNYFDKIGAEFTTGNERDDIDLMLTYLLSVSVRVLIERFGWKPIKYNCRPTRTECFINYVIDEVTAIREDDTKDIRDYAREVEQLYGVRVRMEEEGNNDS